MLEFNRTGGTTQGHRYKAVWKFLGNTWYTNGLVTGNVQTRLTQL